MKQEDNIIVPRWFLENVENTLRIQNNINLDKETGETCQDRNVRQSLNGLRKLLKGEELTGRERLEKLQPSLPSNLDDAAHHSAVMVLNSPAFLPNTPFSEILKILDGLFKAGAEWMAGQFQKIEGELVDWYSTSEGKDYCCGIKTSDPFVVPEGFYIRKK